MRSPELTFDLLYDLTTRSPTLTVLVDAPGIGSASAISRDVDLAALATEFSERIRTAGTTNHDEIGVEIARLLIGDPDVGWVFDMAVRSGAESLRLRLRTVGDEAECGGEAAALDGDALHRIPWELLRRETDIHQGYGEFSPVLAQWSFHRTPPVVRISDYQRQRSVTEREWQAGRPTGGGDPEPAKILLVESLRVEGQATLDSQRSLIERSVRGAFVIDTLPTPTKASIKAGLDTRPTVLHINAHGLIDGSGLCLSGGEVLENDHLAELVSARPWIRLVVLSCCYSSLAARRIAEQGVDTVIGVQYETGVGRADRFVGAFYASLAEGTSPLQAMRDGRDEVALGDSIEWALPVIYTRLCADEGDEPARATDRSGGVPPSGERPVSGPWVATAASPDDLRILDARSALEGDELERWLILALGDALAVVPTSDGSHALVTSKDKLLLMPTVPGPRRAMRSLKPPAASTNPLALRTTEGWATAYFESDGSIFGFKYNLLNRDPVSGLRRPGMPSLVSLAVFGFEWIGVSPAGDLVASAGVGPAIETWPTGGWTRIDVADGEQITLAAGLRRSDSGTPALVLVRRDGSTWQSPRFIPLPPDLTVDELQVARGAAPDTVVVRSGDQLLWWTWDQALEDRS